LASGGVFAVPQAVLPSICPDDPQRALPSLEERAVVPHVEEGAMKKDFASG
jgi:hypothetical protein